MDIRTTLATLLLVCATGLAAAAEPRVFSQAEFDRLAREGRPVVVDVAATWCPTCKAQKPIVDRLVKQADYRDVAVLTVDFDADKPVLKTFKAGMQSTLIAFKGGKEVGRSVGDTTPAGIEALFRKASR
jgi:thiol-disulfide isomerase/thioredoxin